ncbi:MAG: MBL fold metallo-hydrolase [Firmicutes bacterium]|nr:MBL fold metallo-hydrolase [Bacillota bacterium]
MRRKRFFAVRLVVFLVIAAAVGTGFIWNSQIEDFVNHNVLGNERPHEVVSFDGGMYVHFIDVGQGDAIVMEIPVGNEMQRVLIDAGRWNLTRSQFRNYLSTYIFPNNQPWVFDWIIATHSHADHIGDMAYILNRTGTRVNNIVRPMTFTVQESIDNVPASFGILPGTQYTVHRTSDNPNASPATFQNFVDAMDTSVGQDGVTPTNIVLPERGLRFDVGDAEFTFYSPTRFSYGPAPTHGNGFRTTSVNVYSTIFCVQFGGSTMLFTGDAYVVNEYRVLGLEYPSGLPASPTALYPTVAVLPIPTNVDIFDLGHHGSTTSNSLRFLEHITPSFAIIQVGTRSTGNTFNHPHNVILNRLAVLAIPPTVVRTDELGDILARLSTDGQVEVAGIVRPNTWFSYWMLATTVLVIAFGALLAMDLFGKKNNNARNNNRNNRQSTPRATAPATPRSTAQNTPRTTASRTTTPRKPSVPRIPTPRR